MNPSSNTFPVVILFPLACSLNASHHRMDQQFNVLFVVIDDLRPALGCYEELGTDPHETHNVANLRDRKTTARRPSKFLAAGWRRALPTEKEGK